MPHVTLLSPDVTPAQLRMLNTDGRDFIAVAMSCHIDAKVSGGRRFLQLTRSQVDLIVPHCTRDSGLAVAGGSTFYGSDSPAIILLDAFDMHRDRMDNLPARMARICRGIKTMLGIPKGEKVSWTFGPVAERHWGEV